MANKAEEKLKPITKEDLEEYLGQTSDFQFEMSVVNSLRGLAYKCAHAGTYVDPVSEKIRAYDFRARRDVTEQQTLMLAVECKNIRSTSPLLIYATPRTDDEAFHCLIRRKTYDGGEFPDVQKITAMPPAYPAGRPVGRSCDQVTRTSGGFSGKDTETFEKSLQALHSARDLVLAAATETCKIPHVYAIVPVLVVPDERLWEIDYDDDGKVQAGVRQVASATVLYNHEWVVQRGPSTWRYTVSHLEIITYGALRARLDYVEERIFSNAHTLLGSP